ncbi:MAG: PmoA family protein [Planctomycetes bacterium]|nr:PmoA family protein [Planctomycetota bacterium]
MGVRVRTSMTEDKGKGRLSNAEGQGGERAVWGRKSAWCDYSGPVSLGKEPGTGAPARAGRAGIALFDDPGNAYPACWHSRGYGLMAANPFGRRHAGFSGARDRKDLVKLSKGEHLKLRYGILLHTEDVKEGKVAEKYERFLKTKD